MSQIRRGGPCPGSAGDFAFGFGFCPVGAQPAAPADSPLARDLIVPCGTASLGRMNV